MTDADISNTNIHCNGGLLVSENKGGSELVRFIFTHQKSQTVQKRVPPSDDTFPHLYYLIIRLSFISGAL